MSRKLVIAFISTFVALALSISIFFSTSSSRITHAASAQPHLLTCTRGSNCAGKDPTQYQSSLGGCSVSSTPFPQIQVTDDAGTVWGHIIPYYNHNCDVWYGLGDNLSSDSFAEVLINNAAQSYFRSFANPNNSVFYGLTLYDGASQTTVFVCETLNTHKATGCGHS